MTKRQESPEQYSIYLFIRVKCWKRIQATIRKHVVRTSDEKITIDNDKEIMGFFFVVFIFQVLLSKNYAKPCLKFRSTIERR